jgi:hypothetical protein
LQQNVGLLLRYQLGKSDRCGQQITIQQAILTPASPASVLVVRLHFERWICLSPSGVKTPIERIRPSNYMVDGFGQAG